MNKRNHYSAEFKTKVVLEILSEESTINQIAAQYGISRIIRQDDQILVNRKKVRRMMRDMGVYSIYPKPNLSKRYHAQYVRPYLLRKLAIIRPNQVWGIDITYIRMAKVFMYPFIIIDWYSRKSLILSSPALWR